MNNCKNCNQSCNNGDCGCIPQGMTTPNYCPADLPTCPDPSPCNETFDSKCVYYTGVGNECVGLENGQTVEEALETISTALNPFFCLECINFALPANGALSVPVNQVFTWNMVPGATCYDLYLGTSSTTLVLVSLGQILTTYTHPTPLLEGENYYWQVIPRNDAGTPKLDCPVLTFTTFKFLCTNPISYILDNIVSESEDLTDPITVIEVATSFLQNGLLLTNCDLCCPDCTETHRYVLASVEAYAYYYTSVYSETCLPPCCIEIDATLNAYTSGLVNRQQENTSLIEIFQTIPPPTNCCGTNFKECSERIRTILGPNANDIYNILGIVEESTINGSTTLCILADFLESLPVVWTTVTKAEFLAAILELGLVIDCRPEGTIIATIQNYVSYLELININNGGCLCYEPCAITLPCLCYEVVGPIQIEDPYYIESTDCLSHQSGRPIVTNGGTYYVCSETVPTATSTAPITITPLPLDCATGECVLPCVSVCYEVITGEFIGTRLMTHFDCTTLNTVFTGVLGSASYYICSGTLPVVDGGLASITALPNACADGECVPL